MFLTKSHLVPLASVDRLELLFLTLVRHLPTCLQVSHFSRGFWTFLCLFFSLPAMPLLSGLLFLCPVLQKTNFGSHTVQNFEVDKKIATFTFFEVYSERERARCKFQSRDKCKELRENEGRLSLILTRYTIFTNIISLNLPVIL